MQRVLNAKKVRKQVGMDKDMELAMALSVSAEIERQVNFHPPPSLTEDTEVAEDINMT